ncbi:MAG: ABC transporter ATP-binding protein [Burkholderiales bacterium]|nr:ABC transporter ATP-binding protein [Burkholderiales bacterium]
MQDDTAPAAREAPLLDVRDVTVRFGGIVALDRVSFALPAGGICGLIGPNGAGKTTLFNCLSRLYRPASGSIVFDGRDLGAIPRHRIAHAGIGRTFQNLALFRTLTVLQNVMLGCHSGTRRGFVAHALRLPGVAREEADIAARAAELVARLDLGAVAQRPVGELPFGTQKRVELARAMAARPRLLLLDEPAAGLNHAEVDALMDLIRALRDDFGLTVLLVEHHMNLVMRVSDLVVALDFGRCIASGLPAAVRDDPAVIAAYLGAPA